MKYNFDDGGLYSFGEEYTVPTYEEMYPNLSGGSNNFGLSPMSFDDTSYLNFGLSDPYNQYQGQMPDFASNNESPFSGIDMPETADGGWTDKLLGLGGDAAKWLMANNAQGRGNWTDVLGAGMGALGLYGNYQAGQANQAMNKDQLALARELGLGNLSLNQDKFRLDQGIDDMASKAMGMQLLVNRGRMTADQVNPWLNMMYTGRNQMFKDSNVGDAFQANPFMGSPVGIAVNQPTSANQFFRGLDPTSSISRAHGGAIEEGEESPMSKGALGLLRGNSLGQADDVNANLSHGEYVFDSDVVSALGDGNTEAGAAKLDHMREEIRKHKRSAPKSKIPPKAKDPMKYLGAK